MEACVLSKRNPGTVVPSCMISIAKVLVDDPGQKMQYLGPGEVTGWLRAHITLSEDPGSVPRTLMVADNHQLTAELGDPLPSSSLHSMRQVHGAQIT